MALVSQTGSAHRIGVESVRRSGGFMAFKLCTHMESLKMKENLISASSLSYSSGNLADGLRIDSARMRSKRGGRLIVATGAPAEEATVATQPLTKEDLVAYLASGCKPKEKWRLIFHTLSRI